VIHKVQAYIAPKLIGGSSAPSPLGDLGFEKMTQALPVCDVVFEPLGSDMSVVGYLPSSGGLAAVVDVVERSPPGAADSRVAFYKAWDAYGAFSNFSPHPISIALGGAVEEEWPSVEARQGGAAAPRRLGSPLLPGILSGAQVFQRRFS